MGRGKKDRALTLSDTRMRLRPTGDLSWPKLATRIPAEVHSDDEKYKARFDALEYFQAASDEELVKLADESFGHSYEADAVAHHFEGQLPAIDELFAYLATNPTHEWSNERVGFEVEIDLESAQQWIREERPYLVPWFEGDCLFATPHYQVCCFEEKDVAGTPLGKTWEVLTTSTMDVERAFGEDQVGSEEAAIAWAQQLESQRP